MWPGLLQRCRTPKPPKVLPGVRGALFGVRGFGTSVAGQATRKYSACATKIISRGFCSKAFLNPDKVWLGLWEGLGGQWSLASMAHFARYCNTIVAIPHITCYLLSGLSTSPQRWHTRLQVGTFIYTDIIVRCPILQHTMVTTSITDRKIVSANY